MKNDRQNKILDIIETYSVETQEELVNYLKEAGLKVTQSTISRDIKELQLYKAVVDGKIRYKVKKSDEFINVKYIRVLKDGYVSMEKAQNLLVIKTISGMAMAVAAAIDSLEFSEVVGCIAGDDTVMCATHDINEADSLMKKIQELTYES